MDPTRRPRDIEARAFRLACQVVRFCDRLCQAGSICRCLAIQLARSGTSIGANLEEAAAGQSRADFVAKSGIALKEARETLDWLRLVSASCGLEWSRDATELAGEASQIVAILTTIIRKARSTESRRGAVRSGIEHP